MFIVDSHAWISYFKGDVSAEILGDLINNRKRLITIECCLSEIKCIALRDWSDFKRMKAIIAANSTILPVLQENWLGAAQIRHDIRKTVQRFGLIDAILVSRQKDLKCKILTGNPHFKKMKNVLYIGPK
ncbi:PIN domain-containing protein [Candidatus Woesearchaeota archaeon]|nr:PIN domain-containing protein [Candidatus Woesearchaeota archaeon]